MNSRSFAAEWYAAGRDPRNLTSVGRHLADQIGKPDLAEAVMVRHFLPSAVAAEDEEDEAAEKRMLLRAVFSTSEWNRNDEKVDQEGWETASFAAYPVILLGHDYESAPFDAVVGKALIETLTKKPNLSGVFELMNDEDGKGRRLYALAKFLGALTTSPGFIPLEWEMVDNPDKPWKRVHYHAQELIELSVPTIPANASALAFAVQNGLLTDDLKPLVRQTEDAPVALAPSAPARKDGLAGAVGPEIPVEALLGLATARLLLGRYTAGRGRTTTER